VPNTESDIHTNVSDFLVNIEGFQDNHWESVAGMGISIEDIPLHEKKNQMENKPGRFNAKDITLTRRFGKDKDVIKWVNALKSGKVERKSGSIILRDAQEQEVFRYNFYDAWVKEYEGPDLSKGTHDNTLLTERVVLSVGDLELS
jgi:phage tail-like protein